MPPRTYQKLIKYVKKGNFRNKLYNGWAGTLMAQDHRVDPTDSIIRIIDEQKDNFSYDEFMKWLNKLPTVDNLYNQRLDAAFKRLGSGVHDAYIDYVYASKS